MKHSLRFNLVISGFLMVVITYITTIIIYNKENLIGSNWFTLEAIIVIIILFLVSLLISSIIYKMIIYPMKKIEKSMKSVFEGKIIEPKYLKEYSKYTEIYEFIDAYSDMMQVIRKNNFDLNSQKSKTEIILEHMADGVVAYSVSMQVVHMNKSAMALLNISQFDDTFEKVKEKLQLNIEFDQVMYLPHSRRIEQRVNVNDNVLNIVFVPFYNDKLIPMGVIMVARNVTENVRLDNLRKEFVANVSHELKTPLTSIKGYSETIMNGGLSFQEMMRFAKVINQEANRMDRLVVDLLQLSKFDYKKVSLKKVMINLEELTKNVCEKMKFVALEKQHKLEYIVSEATPKIYADKDSIEQVIVNIISNSIKYTPEGGVINVYVGYNNNNAYVKVIDNGIGIPAKDLKRIFDRFYRVDKARSRSMGGTGLGLSIVKEIIDANNGNVEIRSQINRGTEVTITLPTKMYETMKIN